MKIQRRLLCTFVLPLVLLTFPAELLSQNGTAIVISQIYGGGGNQGALYRNDFVELFNRSGAAVNVTGWTIQYASATGSFWVRTELSGIIQPGQYYLVQEEQGNGGSLSLPTPDALGGIGLSATSGKVALVRSTQNLTGTSPTGNDIVDFVGYGDANHSLGLPAAELTNITAARRSGNGCIDSRNNASDFTVGTPTPRNRQSSLNPCVASCIFSLSANSANIANTGGGVSIVVTTSVNCTWSVTNLASWITITSGSNGNGPGTVILSVLANPSIQPRTATLTIAGQTFTITQSPGLRFVPLPPCRLMETRSEYNFEGRTGAFGPPFIQSGQTRTLTLANSTVCSVPAAAKAYVLNVTAIPRGPLDYVTLYPSGTNLPNFWTVRSPDGQIVANSAIVAAGGGAINVYTSNDTDMLIDISGYFTDTIPGGTNLVFYPLSPCRVIETRSDYRSPAGEFGPPSMAAGTTRRFRFPQSPHCTIPAGASAYSATLTVVPPASLAYMTLWPTGASQPNVSSINSFAGRVLANNVIIPASADGSIDVFASNQTDFLVDITGYFAADNGQGLYYFPVTQCRAQDSTQYADDTTRTIAVPTAGNCTGIPATAKGYSVNVTAIPEGNPMPFITVYPTGQGRPNASILNAFQGQTVTGGGIIPAGAGGAIDVYAFRRTNIVVDVSGYFGR